MMVFEVLIEQKPDKQCWDLEIHAGNVTFQTQAWNFFITYKFFYKSSVLYNHVLNSYENVCTMPTFEILSIINLW